MLQISAPDTKVLQWGYQPAVTTMGENLGAGLGVMGRTLTHMRQAPRDPSTKQAALKDVIYNKSTRQWEYDEGQEGDFERRCPNLVSTPLPCPDKLHLCSKTHDGRSHPVDRGAWTQWGGVPPFPARCMRSPRASALACAPKDPRPAEHHPLSIVREWTSGALRESRP